MLSWLHTVDMDNLPLDFGGAEGKGRIFGDAREMKTNGCGWSCSAEMTLSLAELEGSETTLGGMGWSCIRFESTPLVVTG